jgi:hypothetical protein
MIQVVIPTERSERRSLLFRRKSFAFSVREDRCRGRSWQLRGGYSLSLSAHLKPRRIEFRLRERKAVLCETLARYLPLLGGAETGCLSSIDERAHVESVYFRMSGTAISMRTFKHVSETPHPEPFFSHRSLRLNRRHHRRVIRWPLQFAWLHINH